ncbi:MAG: hypothetical protein IJ772_04865 [Bacilli bacterium]|nr:hypothetical protein [Bacilli bacterium]
MEVLTGLTEDTQFVHSAVAVSPFDIAEGMTQDELDNKMINSFADFVLKNPVLIDFLYRQNENLKEEDILGFDPEENPVDRMEKTIKKEKKKLAERRDDLIRFILERRDADVPDTISRVDQSPILAMFSKLCVDYYDTFKNTHKVYRDVVVESTYAALVNSYSVAYQCAFYSNRTKKSMTWKLTNLKEVDKKLRGIIPGLDIAFREKIISFGKHRVILQELGAVQYAVGSWIKIISNKLDV